MGGARNSGPAKWSANNAHANDKSPFSAQMRDKSAIVILLREIRIAFDVSHTRSGPLARPFPYFRSSFGEPWRPPEVPEDDMSDLKVEGPRA